MNEKWISPTLITIQSMKMVKIFDGVEDVEELKLREEAAVRALCQLYDKKLKELKNESKRAEIVAAINGSKEQIS